MTKKDVFKEVWIEWFGEDKEVNKQLEVALKHDYIFEAMDRWAQLIKIKTVNDIEKIIKE